ncbi:MAG TPA: glycosyltransferase family 39 protein [Candidatus Dormibacteraeota bacterium]|nr:glycosyltransferase family 39 protein [Candidatus Dormibacteraeota bacterium]
MAIPALPLPAAAPADDADRQPQKRASSIAALAACVAFAALLALPNLGVRPLYSAGEVRNALIAHAMLVSGDWVQPRLNGARYYEKPPLIYWSMAAAYGLLGVSETAARLPAALAFLATVGLVFGLGRELLGRRSAVASALIFATAAAPYHFARFVSLDTVTTAALTLAMYGLVIATRGDRTAGIAPAPHAGAVCFWVGASLAGLTKGLLGLAFPIATALLYALVIGGRATVVRLRPWLGALIVAVVWLPWHVALAWRDPTFVPFFVLNEHVYRFLNIREPIDYEPLSIPAFWLATALWFFPWVLLLPAAAAATWRARRRLAIPALWVLFVIGFFTLARSRLEYYGQPAYPCLAVLIAAAWQLHYRRALLAGSALLLVIGAAAAVLVWGYADAHTDITALVTMADGYYREYFAKRPDRAFFFGHEALMTGRPFALWLLALGGTALAALARRRVWLAFACWVMFLTPALNVFDRGIMLLVDDRSQRHAAELVTARWQPGDAVAVVGTYEDGAGLTLYTGLPTLMVDGTDGDMLFGFRQGDVPDRFLDRAAFDALWHSPTRVFALAQIEKAPPDGTVLLETPRHRLMVNRP